MDKMELLKQVSFGAQVAEDEVDALQRYFVETDQWNRIRGGSTDIIYGAKGSGKSALYALLGSGSSVLGEKGAVPVPGELPRGNAAFAAVVADPPTNEREFIALWKSYILSLIGRLFKEKKVGGSEAKRVLKTLEKAGLLVDVDTGLPGLLRRAQQYARSVSIEPRMQIADQTTYSLALTLEEPSPSQAQAGSISIDQLLTVADQALASSGIEAWIVLDRLDVAFSDNLDLEQSALRALFRVYLDNLRLGQVKLKVFIRTDIWDRITDSGFREASHITRDITIKWDKTSLMNLLVRRLLDNPGVCKFLGIDKDAILASAAEQEEVFYRVFPAQVDVGAKKPSTFDWMLKRVRDGKGEVAPRELIHLVNAAREEQIRQVEMGQDLPAGEQLIGHEAIKAALTEVSEKRLQQTLFAEHPDLKPYIKLLGGEKTEQRLETLSAVWSEDLAAAQAIAGRLVDVGFFELKGTKQAPIYAVPFLYRPAARMIQGKARTT